MGAHRQQHAFGRVFFAKYLMHLFQRQIVATEMAAPFVESCFDFPNRCRSSSTSSSGFSRF